MKRLQIKLTELIENYLQSEDYDGLFNPDGECACKIGELAPYDACNPLECCPGYEEPCTPETCWEGGGHKFHVMPGAEEAENDE